MADEISALPESSGAAEKALADAVRGNLSVDVPIGDIWNPDKCPTAVLPWLAWALSVDEWDPAWPEATKREVIAQSVEVHRRKGTRWAVKRILALMGYGDTGLIEFWDLPKIGDAIEIGGAWKIGWSGMTWADYVLEIRRPIDRAEADRIAARVQSVAPARSRLWRIVITEGVYYTIGDGLWAIGGEIGIGASYDYSDTGVLGWEDGFAGAPLAVPLTSDQGQIIIDSAGNVLAVAGAT